MSMSRCGQALYKHVVDELQTVKVRLVKITMARFFHRRNENLAGEAAVGHIS